MKVISVIGFIGKVLGKEMAGFTIGDYVIEKGLDLGSGMLWEKLKNIVSTDADNRIINQVYIVIEESVNQYFSYKDNNENLYPSCELILKCIYDDKLGDDIAINNALRKSGEYTVDANKWRQIFFERISCHEQLFNYIVLRLHDSGQKRSTLQYEEIIRQISELKHNMDDQKNSIENKIYLASKEYFLQLTSKNNKFGELKIFENLFPKGVFHENFNDYYASSENGNIEPVIELYDRNKEKHLVFIGEGGIGKTTFLAYQLEKYLINKESPEIIPIYIELNRCPEQIGSWCGGPNNKTNFITRYIQTLIDHCNFEDCKKEDLATIDQEFSKNTDKPRYLLLLDGFNEVNTRQSDLNRHDMSNRDYLQSEIEQLTSYRNVRIILTTRNMATRYLPQNLQPIFFIGLGTKNIREYLGSCMFSTEEINWIEAHESLMDCLRVPLFLHMYASRDKNEMLIPLNRGEILYHFFHRDSPFYSEKRKVHKNYINDKATKNMVRFTIDYILPIVAYRMKKNGLFTLKKRELSKYIESALGDTIFNPVRNYIEIDSNYESVEDSLYDLYSQMIQCKPVEFMNIMVNLLAVIHLDGTHYGFIHHHIRDYFAAYYVVQRIREANAVYLDHAHDKGSTLKADHVVNDQVRECLEPIYYEILDDVEMAFVGEILGENRNAPIWDSEINKWILPPIIIPEPNTLRNVLDIYRNNDYSPKYVIHNIVNIMMHVRKTVAGENFDGLDLRDTRFYEIPCSIGTLDNQLSASFRNCKIGTQTFWFEGHIERTRDFMIQKNTGDTIVTLGADESIIIWNKENKLIKASYIVGNFLFSGESIQNVFINISNLGELLVCCYEDSTTQCKSSIRYISGDINKLLCASNESRIINDMRFSPFGSFILGVWGGNTIRIFHNDDSKSLYKEFFYAGKGEVQHVLMPDESYLILHICVSEDHHQNSPTFLSEWAYYKLNINNEDIELIYEYKTKRKVGTGIASPACSFSEYQNKCLIFTDSKIINLNFNTLEEKEIDQLSNDIVPEYMEFLDIEGNLAFATWQDTIKVYESSSNDIIKKIHRNIAIENWSRIHMVDNQIYFLNDEEDFLIWNLTTDAVEKYQERVHLEIRKLDADDDSHIYVEYNNNCIITYDSKEQKIVSCFYQEEMEGTIEICTFLKKSQKNLIVIKNQYSEQILLLDPITGYCERIKVLLAGQQAYRSVLEDKNSIYLAFDKEIICIENVASGYLTYSTVWKSNTGDTFFDFSFRDDIMYVLTQWKFAFMKPIYQKYKKNEAGVFERIGSESVKYITEEEATNLLIIGEAEFFVTDAISGKEIFTVKGVKTNPLSDIHSFSLDSELSGERYFFMKNASNPLADLVADMNAEFIHQITSDRIVTITDYEKISIYQRLHNTWERVCEYVYPEHNLKQTILSGMHNLFFSTYDDKLFGVNLNKPDEIIQYDWLPGIIVNGCDFTGSHIDENLKKTLIKHGGTGLY